MCATYYCDSRAYMYFSIEWGPGGISKNAEVDMTAAHNAVTVTLN